MAELTNDELVPLLRQVLGAADQVRATETHIRLLRGTPVNLAVEFTIDGRTSLGIYLFPLPAAITAHLERDDTTYFPGVTARVFPMYAQPAGELEPYDTPDESHGD